MAPPQVGTLLVGCGRKKKRSELRRVSHQPSNSPLMGQTSKVALPKHREESRKNSTRCPEGRELDISNEQIHSY